MRKYLQQCLPEVAQMATFSNMAALKKAIQKEAKAAMRDAQKKMYTKTQQEVQDFYSQGSPYVYKRTGALGNTPQTTPIQESGDTISYEIYLDQSHKYDTGRDLRSMSATLPAAEAGDYGILGKPGFWQRSEGEFQDILDSAMAQHFS